MITIKRIVAGITVTGALTAIAASLPPSRTIDFPIINYSNTSALEISNVELTDSSTIVNVNVHFRPHNWIKIQSGCQLRADGKNYALKGTEKIVPDSLFWMPDSGVADFSLIFEPLPYSTTEFDFIEGDTQEDWKLWNIDISGKEFKEYPDGVPSELRKNAVDGPVPDPAFEIGTTTVRFHMLPYIDGYVDDAYLYVNCMDGSQKEMSVKFDKNGEGSLTFDQYGTVTAWLVDPIQHISLGAYTFYPGETVDCYVDMRLTGFSSMINNKVNKKCGRPHNSINNGKYYNYDLMQEKGDFGYPNSYYGLDLYTGNFADYRMSGADYKAMVKRKYDSMSDSIASLDAPQMIKDIKKFRLQNEVLKAIGDYRYFLEHNYRKVHDAWRQSDLPSDSIPGILTDNDFAEVATWFDIDNPKLAIYYDSALGNGFDWNAQGVKGDLSKSMNLYCEYARKAESLELTQKDIDELKTLSNPFFATACDSIYTRSKRSFEKLQSSISYTPTPDVADEAIFDAIIAPHKGKVVMVDLWNTWCGPCRQSIKVTEPMKDNELSDKDIVWIYIADETSDPNKYLEMISNIRGIHYKLTRPQKAIINNRFNVDGIPYYILVDREGNAEGRPDLRNHSEYIKAIKSKL